MHQRYDDRNEPALRLPSLSRSTALLRHIKSAANTRGGLASVKQTLPSETNDWCGLGRDTTAAVSRLNSSVITGADGMAERRDSHSCRPRDTGFYHRACGHCKTSY